MRLHAYVLLADPEWLETSVRSYYDHVDRIVASYDRSSTGWSGQRVQVDTCREILKRIDVEGKVCWMPGDHVDPSRTRAVVETEQRQVALDAAAEGADWVLQLDADEVIPDWHYFRRRLGDVAQSGSTAFWYPQRWLFSHVGGPLFVERSIRHLRTESGLPGPSALRPGSRLVFMRQDDSDRLLLRIGGGQPWSVPRRKAVLHFSWIRTIESMAAKAATSSHAHDFDWGEQLQEWARAECRPLRFFVGNVRSPKVARMKPALVGGTWRDALVPRPSLRHRGRVASSLGLLP